MILTVRTMTHPHTAGWDYEIFYLGEPKYSDLGSVLMGRMYRSWVSKVDRYDNTVRNERHGWSGR